MILVPTDCTLCPLHTTRTNVVQPQVPHTIRVLFVGRDPGTTEDTTGIPFHPTAPAGTLLRQLVHDVGIPEEWCGYSNTVQCHTPKNRGPRAAEILACGVHRERIRRVVQPEYVVLLGQEAIEGHLNNGGYRPTRPLYPIGVHGGTSVLHDGTTYILAHHPSAALRNTSMRRMLVGELRVVAQLLGVSSPTPSVLPVEYDPTDVTECSLDVESRIDTGEMIGFSLVWHNGSEVVGKWYSGSSLHHGLEVVRNLRCDRMVMHNSKYDLGKLLEMGVPIQCDIEDTYIMAHLLRKSRLGLKELSQSMLGLTWTTLAQLGKPEDTPDEELGMYCMYDAAATLQLYHVLWEEAGRMQ